MQNKTCIVTGANTGLGFETAKALAQHQAEVIMICRSEEKGVAARQRIVDATQNPNVHVLQTDLSKQGAIRETANHITSRWDKVDVLINNAASVISTQQFNEEGIELQFAINHLAYFLLTHTLLGSLQKSSKARIINIGSGNHKRGKIYFDNLNLNDNYHVMRAYNQTKLANLLFTYELDRRLKLRGLNHLSVHCVNPGLNATDIGVKATTFFHGLAWKIRRSMGMAPAEGAKTQIHVAISPELDNQSGKYWFESKIVPSAPHSYNEEDARRLWGISKELCKIDDYFNL